MKISKYIHACILLEEKDRGLLFDPGALTFMDGGVQPELFTGLDVVVITHHHSDHLDAKGLQAILAHNEGAVVVTNAQIAAELQKSNITATVLEQGSLQAGVFTVEAMPATHEALLSGEVPTNIAYRVNGQVVHPGDSMSPDIIAWQASEVLLLPIVAPWLTEKQVGAFAVMMAPKMVIPIHDGYVKDFFAKSRHAAFTAFLEPQNIQFVSLLGAGQSHTI